PKELAEAIRSEIDGFSIQYEPDFRNKIARSWPDSLNDSTAHKDWGWKAQYDIDKLVEVMLTELRKKKAEAVTF
ncbi:MAG: NAD-dependent epimerase, partial [Flavobacteriales bacterium]|nr:NAD-dependent epimerase [Flavobacteriales bacterium]